MNIKIAIFDQCPHIQLLFWYILTNRGYAVFILDEDETGLKQVAALQADLIILGNIRSNHENDFQFLMRLRAQPATKTTPVIIATTAAPRLLQSATLEQETHVSFLFKPFHQQALLACVEGGLNAARRGGKQASTFPITAATCYL